MRMRQRHLARRPGTSAGRERFRRAMPRKTYDAGYWRKRAKEARAQAQQMSTSVAERQLEIASVYDQLAKSAGEQKQRNASSEARSDVLPAEGASTWLELAPEAKRLMYTSG